MEYITSEERVVPLRRVAPRYVDQIRAKHTIPDPPTYSFKAGGGVEVTLPHDEKSIEQSGPEAHKEWNEYKKTHREKLAAQEQDVLEFLIFQCIDQEPEPVADWSVDFALHGLEPPDESDPVKFKVEWVQSEILANEDDYAGLMTRLYEMGGLVDSNRAMEFEGLFQLVVERLAAAALRGAAK